MSISDKLATPEEVARALGRKLGYIYKLASLHQWRRLRHEGRVYYHWDDVGKTLGQ